MTVNSQRKPFRIEGTTDEVFPAYWTQFGNSKEYETNAASTV